MDTLEIWVEISERVFSDQLGALANLQARIEREINDTLGIASHVKLVEPRSIERSQGKAKRIIDRRDVYAQDAKKPG